MTPLNEDTINAAMAALRERIVELEAFDAASKVTIEKMAKRINELEAMVAKAVAIIDYDASERLVELDAISYVEGCKP